MANHSGGWQSRGTAGSEGLMSTKYICLAATLALLSACSEDARTGDTDGTTGLADTATVVDVGTGSGGGDGANGAHDGGAQTGVTDATGASQDGAVSRGLDGATSDGATPAVDTGATTDAGTSSGGATTDAGTSSGGATTDAGTSSGGATTDVGTSGGGCASAKVTLVGGATIDSKSLDFPDVCKTSTPGDILKLSLAAGDFTFDWQPMTTEPPRITVTAVGMVSGQPKALGQGVEITVPRPQPMGQCGTKTSAKKPADIGTATLTWASEKSGSKYTLQAKGKAYCFGSSSGGSSWESFSLTISGTL
jgi:hypothetical protein